MIEKNKDGIGSRFLREAGIGYARTHGNSEGEAQSEKYRERSGQIHLLPASPDEGDKMCLIKNENVGKGHKLPVTDSIEMTVEGKENWERSPWRRKNHGRDGSAERKKPGRETRDL